MMGGTPPDSFHYDSAFMRRQKKGFRQSEKFVNMKRKLGQREREQVRGKT